MVSLFGWTNPRVQSVLEDNSRGCWELEMKNEGMIHGAEAAAISTWFDDPRLTSLLRLWTGTSTTTSTTTSTPIAAAAAAWELLRRREELLTDFNLLSSLFSSALTNQIAFSSSSFSSVFSGSLSLSLSLPFFPFRIFFPSGYQAAATAAAALVAFMSHLPLCNDIQLSVWTA